MKLNGIKLKEITKPQVFDPPKKLLVSNGGKIIGERTVVAILSDEVELDEKVISISTVDNRTIFTYGLCFEIPKSRRVTYRELSKWLAQGNGELRVGTYVKHYNFEYSMYEEDLPALETWRVRKWEDKDWNEPTAAYLGLEE